MLLVFKKISKSLLLITNFDRFKCKIELIEDFVRAFTNSIKANIHVRLPYGKTTHHRAEAIFKAFARALSDACSKGKRVKGIPSTKGKI